MKKTRTAFAGVAAAAGLLIPAGAAQAATPASHASVQATGTVASATDTCRSFWGNNHAFSNQSTRVPADNFAEAEWTNNGCHYQGRVHIRCEFVDGSTHDYDGGWVYPNGLNDAAHCADGSWLIGAAWQARGGPGQTVDTDWWVGP